MEVLELQNYSQQQYKGFLSYLHRLIYEALDKEELDHIWQKVDLALKQSYQDSIFVDAAHGDNFEFNDSDFIEQERRGEDEFSDMYTPLIYKLHKGWVTHLKEALIPNTGDWFSIERKYSSFFDELGINNFLPIMNRCWEKNLLVENERFQLTQKIKRAISQFCAYGASPATVFYDAVDHFVDVKVMPLRDFGIYPITDDWRKSNSVYRYPVNYADLVARDDLDQEAVSQIRPWTEFNEEDSLNAHTPTSRSQQYEEYQAPYGMVMLHDIWIPSLYVPGYEQYPDIIERGVHLTVAFNPRLKENSDIYETTEGTNIVVLKAVKDVSAMEYSSLFAHFDEVLPYQQHGKGPLIPFLIFQAFQNQLVSGMSRDVARETDPAIILRSGERDIDDTPFPEFQHGAIYEGIEVEPVTVEGIDRRLQSYLAWDKYITEMVEEASGMTKLQVGGRPASRRTKFEVQEQLDAGGLRINDAADLFDEGFLKPFMTSRVVQTQHQIEYQIEEGVKFLQEQDPTVDPLNAYETVLRENKLFARMLNFTAVEPKYKEFYKQHQSRMQENDQYVSEFQNLLTQMASLQQQLAAPFQPFQEPANVEEFDESSIEAAKQQFYQAQQAQREEMKKALNQIQERAKSTQLLIEDIQEIPAPSLYFYYLLLIEPINESDIIIYGAKSTLNKSMKRRGILELFEALKGIPPEKAAEIDITKLLSQYSSIIDLPYESIKLPEEEINRRKQQIQQAQQQAQLQAQAQGNATQ